MTVDEAEREDSPCPNCNGKGYVITAQAVYPPSSNAHPSEAEPCEDCPVAYEKGWL